MPDIEISTDTSRLDQLLIHRFLSEESYWARGITEAQLRQAIARSVCFGAYAAGEQVGFARVVGDGITFAYLAEMFVLREMRGKGIGKALLAAVLAHESMQVGQVVLSTFDARRFYRGAGFRPVSEPGRWRERRA